MRFSDALEELFFITQDFIFLEKSSRRSGKQFVKIFFSILLASVLLSSLVGVSYAAPTVLSSPCPPNSNISPTDCHNPNNGADPHHHGCSAIGQKGPDVPCCPFSHGSEDGRCCGVSITPNDLQVSDIQVAVC